MRPLALARARPSFVRSLIISRSNWLKLPSMFIMRRPAGCVVSIDFRARKGGSLLMSFRLVLFAKLLHQGRVPAELLFVDLIPNRSIGWAFGAVHVAQRELIGKPALEPPQRRQHVPRSVFPNVCNVVFAQKFFPFFLRLLEPPLILWVALHVLPEALIGD